MKMYFMFFNKNKNKAFHVVPDASQKLGKDTKPKY
jgi:hypothetical protein